MELVEDVSQILTCSDSSPTVVASHQTPSAKEALQIPVVLAELRCHQRAALLQELVVVLNGRVNQRRRNGVDFEVPVKVLAGRNLAKSRFTGLNLGEHLAQIFRGHAVADSNIYCSLCERVVGYLVVVALIVDTGFRR